MKAREYIFSFMLHVYIIIMKEICKEKDVLQCSPILNTKKM